MAGFRIEGNTSGNLVEVDSSNQMKVVPETDASANPGNVGCVRTFSENDSGTYTGTPQLLSPETDLDYRLRVGQDTYLDQETYDYGAQNTGKYTFTATTMAVSYSVNGLQTNSGAIVTASTGFKYSSYAYFPITNTSTLSLDFEASFSAVGVTGETIDFGFFLPGAGNPYAPTDGVYLRFTSAGLVGVANFNGVETETAPFSLVPVLNQKYQFILYINQRTVEFWINNGTSTDLYGVIQTPIGNPQPCASAALPVAMRQAIGAGGASGVLSMLLGSYNVRLGGPNFSRTLGEFGNAAYGSYQGLSGGAMGSLANYANNTNPTAAVPTNTTAALGTGLGGQFWETDTLAVTNDGIICSYQVPAGTTTTQGRRLKIMGVCVDSYIQTTLTGGGYVAQWCIAFGHTGVSLATAEGPATKAPRRQGVGVQAVAAAAAAGTTLSRVNQTFLNPIYVNPGEFVALAKKKVGTAPSAGVVAHLVTLDYAWE